MNEVAQREKILVAMSGGVDSSLAARILLDRGHEIVGVNMRTHRLSREELALGARIKTCCSPTDARDARACAEQGDFPFYVLDVEPDFQRDVIDPFIVAYTNGRTPNPCVLCNSHVKLGLLLEKADLWGCARIATGHYSRKAFVEETGRWTLARARDSNKDQTYYLFALRQDQVERLELPLGELTKVEVRALAREAAIPTADKPESQEICFIPSNDYRGFLRRQFAERGVAMPRGKFVSTRGDVLGEHEGIAFYTVGQRRGLGVAGGEPLYVVAIDPEGQNIILGHRDDVMFSGLVAKDMNWMGIEALSEPRRCFAQIRHRHTPAAALATPASDGSVSIQFDEPQQAVSPGQAVVLYDAEDRVLGGGWIEAGTKV